MTAFTFQGTSGSDKVSSYDLFEQHSEYNEFILNGNDGDDNLSLSIINRYGSDQANGGKGDDYMSGFASLTDFAVMHFTGGEGTDKVTFSLSTITDISSVGGAIAEVTAVDSVNGTKYTAVIGNDVEIISYKNAEGELIYYLTEDIANGRIRSVDLSEAFYRAHNENADWYLNGLDTYSDYHNIAPTPIPVAPSPTPDNVSNVLTSPSQFKKKSADKITNFNPSSDTLEIDTDSFGLDSSVTFAVGKNMKAVKKKLANKDFDFLYDEKKGGLYFNENGADKGFGDGGLIAILKGAPDLTMDNIDFV